MVAAIAEGFGPGWTADEACQLSLQALRNRFVEAERENVGEILASGLLAANKVVYERACAYDADGQVGVWMTAAVFVGDHFLFAQIGKGAIYLSRGADELIKLVPNLSTSQEYAIGLTPEIPPLINVRKANREFKDGEDSLSSGSVLMMSHGLDENLQEAAVKKELSRRDSKLIPEHLVKLAQVRSPQASTAAILVQMLAANVGKGKKNIQQPLMAVGGLVLLALLGVIINKAVLKPAAAPPPPVLPSPTTAATIQPTITEILDLPTLIPSSTAIPSPLPTANSLPTQKPTLELPSSTPTPTITQTLTETVAGTPTPIPPTPTETITPSPTIPVAPIGVGGVVVVAGTEGLGISLRDGPSSEAIRIAILLDGARSEVIGGPETEGNLIWWQLSTEDGMEGWAVDRFLQGIAVEEEGGG